MRVKRKYNRKDNPYKRKKVQKKKAKIKDDLIKPYSRKEIHNLNIETLREYCKKNHFETAGNKKTLMDRLLRPQNTIKDLKLKYHMQHEKKGKKFYQQNYIFYNVLVLKI
eukprot:97901_1